MPTIVSVPQQQFSATTRGIDEGGIRRDRRVTDQDVRHPASPMPNTDPRRSQLGSTDARAFREAVLATHFRPFPMPISRVEPVYGTPGDPQQAADEAEAPSPGARFRALGGSWWTRHPTPSRRTRSTTQSPSWG